MKLEDQIIRRREVISTLREEVVFLDRSIEQSETAARKMDRDIERLAKEYTHMMRAAYRRHLNYSSLLFLFSASDLNDAFRRWQYLRQYDRYRKKQASLILETRQLLKENTRELKTQKDEKERLLVGQERQKNLLNEELEDKNGLLKTLEDNEKKLAAELARQRAAHQQLNRHIERIIQAEIAASRKREKETVKPVAASVGMEEDESENLLSFNNLKGDLPWPVRTGFVSRKFGTQPHPKFKGIKIANNGIDIKSDAGAEVYAVYEGKVAGTQFIPGYQHTVIIQHGSYYTVYSNLESIFVERGDRVKSSQAIGRLGESKPEVHFELWRDKDRLDPSEWVIRK